MLSNIRALIVDDEPANRRLLADLVAREGCEAVVASGGAEALAILSREPIDLVLLDLMMPEVDGMAVLTELHKRGLLPALPVVVVTAHEDRKVRIDALSAGAIDFLTKPVDRLEVTCKIRTLVELRRLRDRVSEHAARQATVELYESVHQTLQNLPLLLFRGTITKAGHFQHDWVIGDVEGVSGMSVDEYLRSTNWFDNIHPDDRDELTRVGAELESGAATAWRVRYRMQHPRRGDVWGLSVGNFDPVRGTVMGATLDISAEKALEERLVQVSKMQALGKLAGGVAHDFNNLLSVILSYASFVRDDLPADDERQADLDEVLKAAVRAVDLTRQLLTFSRQQPTAKRPTDLNESLAQIHKLLATSVGTQIELSIIPSARPAVVRIDPIQFDQIVLNLAVNARDAMPDGGQLRIAIDHPPESGLGGASQAVRITVTDTGTGMDERTQLRIFEPFFTTKATGKGTGLGLATCFGIVEDVGGSIRVESAPGRGTTFTVELPWCRDPVAAARDAGQIPRLGHGELVLVVEDDPALRPVTARILESAGYEVVVASDGKEAIRSIDELGSRLDLILSDVVMPGCNGYDVAAHSARITPETAVILTSGYHDTTAQRTWPEDLPILWKPVARGELVRAVSAALATRHVAKSATAATTRNVVLVVEDEDAIRRGLVRLLATAGYAPIPVATVAAAREVLEGAPDPHVVLCDMSLPDGSGAELVQWIQRTRPTLCPRVLILTGEMSDRAARLVESGAALRTLIKPIPSAVLLEALAEIGSLSREPAVVAARARRPTPSLAQVPQAGPAVRTERVLVVDDDEALVAATTRILNNAAFEVVAVGTVAAARHALEGTELDAVVVDVGLPDGDGFDLLRDLRGKNSEIPVVVITGTPSIESATQAVRGRVNEYLAKPFSADELVRVVRAAVDAGRIARLRTKLLAARFGGDEFVGDVSGTEKRFELALPKIRMVFQPIVRSGDGSVFGYEALLRCDEPSMSSPLRLLAAAELLGRVNDVGRAVRASVAATIRAHRDRLEAIFVNLHPSELRADLLAEAIDPLMPLARRVVLEVTERASLEGGARLDDDLARIRNLGYRIAVDDLGEGYAGLSSLVNLRPDVAKIDMSLVRDIDRAPLKRDIVAALVDMARRSGIVVVAEGIETVAERETLTDLGCDLLQGYLFAKPGPPFPAPHPIA